MSLACPRCRAALDIRAQGTCTAALCRRCGGTWLGAEATHTVQVALAPVAHAVAKEGEAHAGGDVSIDLDDIARCANCGDPMRRMMVGPVEVDHCPAHGTWYDLGELEQVATLLVAAQRGEPVPMEDKGVPGPRAAWPGERRGMAATAPNVATRSDTGEALELDTRGRGVIDDNAGMRVAQAYVPPATEGFGSSTVVDEDVRARGQHIAAICRSNGADRKAGTGFSRRWASDTIRSTGVDVLLDVLSDGLLFWS